MICLCFTNVDLSKVFAGGWGGAAPGTGLPLHHPPAALRVGCFISADREQFISAVYISIEDMSKKYY